MNRAHLVVHPECLEVGLVEIIDFKWLMAGVGHRVHVQRLQTDGDYARACLVCGAQSAVPALRATAQRLARAMGICLLP